MSTWWRPPSSAVQLCVFLGERRAVRVPYDPPVTVASSLAVTKCKRERLGAQLCDTIIVDNF